MLPLLHAAVGNVLTRITLWKTNPYLCGFVFSLMSSPRSWLHTARSLN